MKENMTALMSCFARMYHYEYYKYRILNDSVAGKLLSEKEKILISTNLSNGINFFNPSFIGSNDDALRWIIDNQISPSILGRSAFCEKSLHNSIRFGCKQYLIYASGYDTYAYRNNIKGLKIFEIDKESMINDKISRLDKSNIKHDKINYIKCDFTKDNWINNIINSSYDKDIISFSSLLGISYYLTKKEFSEMINKISSIICDGSSIIFDYQTNDDGMETKKNEELASGANEVMKSKYDYKEIEEILSDNGLLIYEHLNDKMMTNMYFYNYNTLNSNNTIIAPKGVSYCLAVKKNLHNN